MNPYEVLGIEANASPDDIDKAFRRLSLKYHPDHGGDPGQFKQLNEAYAVLSDPERRKLFDENGDVSQRKRQRAAESIIAAMVAEAFAQDTRDPIRWMQERIDARRVDHQEMRDKLKAGLVKLIARITAFREANKGTANPEGRDFVLENLTAGEIEMQRAIEKHETEVELITQALTLLNDLKGRSMSGWTTNTKGWGTTPRRIHLDG
jgi:curved DNA-binding protein CbpA